MISIQSRLTQLQIAKSFIRRVIVINDIVGLKNFAINSIYAFYFEKLSAKIEKGYFYLRWWVLNWKLKNEVTRYTSLWFTTFRYDFNEFSVGSICMQTFWKSKINFINSVRYPIIKFQIIKYAATRCIDLCYN